jgi:hypothetical protein
MCVCLPLQKFTENKMCSDLQYLQMIHVAKLVIPEKIEGVGIS